MEHPLQKGVLAKYVHGKQKITLSKNETNYAFILVFLFRFCKFFDNIALTSYFSSLYSQVVDAFVFTDVEIKAAFSSLLDTVGWLAQVVLEMRP